MRILALFATVALLVWMGFFMLGSLPLLILKHDTPLDARFIRGLFDVYYRAVMVTAGIATVCYLAAERFGIAALMAAIAAIAVASSRAVLARMDRLRSTMTPDDAPGIRRFRRLHIGGMLLNVAQLAGLCLGITRIMV